MEDDMTAELRRELQEMYAPQFEGGGPAVLVRNTFIDVELRPPVPEELLRASTAPPTAQYGDGRPAYAGDGEEDEDGEDEEDEDNDEGVENEGGEDAEDSTIAMQDASLAGIEPPEAHSVHRLVTREWYEPHEGWAWASQASSLVPPPQAQPPPMPAPPMMPYAPPPNTGAGSQMAMYAYMPPYSHAAAPVVMPLSMGMGMGTDMSNVAAAVAPAPLSFGGWGTGPAVGQPGLTQMQFYPTAPETQPASEARTTQPPQEAQEEQQQSQQPVAFPPAVAPQPQTLDRHFSITSGKHRIHWTVDGRKLRGKDKQAVSPPFELPFGSHRIVTFKMMIYPKAVHEAKGGASFKKAKGRGYIQLKCEAELQEAIANVAFRISIGSGDQRQTPRGPVYHNFSMSAVCGLPKDSDEWDFHQVVDKESMTFLVCLEIVPGIHLPQAIT